MTKNLTCQSLPPYTLFRNTREAIYKNIPVLREKAFIANSTLDQQEHRYTCEL